MRFKLFFIYATLFIGCATAHTDSPKVALSEPKEEPLLLLSDNDNISELPSFKELLLSDPASEDYESIKVDYLLERLSDSGYAFIRNGEIFSGRRAAIHLKWKFWKNRKHLKTAYDFVYRCASGSKISGKPYKIDMGQRKRYPIRDVFVNELDVLEQKLLEETLVLESSRAKVAKLL